jgi:hypothetical protein
MEQKIGARVDDCGIVKSLKNLGWVRSVLWFFRLHRNVFRRLLIARGIGRSHLARNLIHMAWLICFACSRRASIWGWSEWISFSNQMLLPTNQVQFFWTWVQKILSMSWWTIAIETSTSHANRHRMSWSLRKWNNLTHSWMLFPTVDRSLRPELACEQSRRWNENGFPEFMFSKFVGELTKRMQRILKKFHFSFLSFSSTPNRSFRRDKLDLLLNENPWYLVQSTIFPKPS